MANQEQLAILKQGVKVWNQWRQDHAFIKTDLYGANLGGADLYDADLRDADLYHALQPHLWRETRP